MMTPPRLPPHSRGQRIGLLGGTFNPPHQAHLLVSLTALKRLKLDAVWWLVTPGNPLKNNEALPPLERRITACRKLAGHPRILVTGVERELGTHYTANTIAALKRRAPGVRFVWLMGADNLAQFHRWSGSAPDRRNAPDCGDRPAMERIPRPQFASGSGAWPLPAAGA